MKRFVVLGGGFAGVEAAILLRKYGYDVTIVSNRNYLFIYPISIWIPVNKKAFTDVALPLADLQKKHGFELIIDEVNDLNPRVWPYLKRIIDAEVPIVFAGLPKVRTFLASEHPDILSRLKVLVLYPIVVEDFILEYKKHFKAEAIEQIYMAVRGDMRKFEEICTDCRDRAKELNYSFVDLNLALEFINELTTT